MVFACGTLGLSGEDTKLLAEENEREDGFEGGDSEGRRGDSTFDVGVRGWKVSSGLLDPLGRGSPPS